MRVRARGGMTSSVPRRWRPFIPPNPSAPSFPCGSFLTAALMLSFGKWGVHDRRWNFLSVISSSGPDPLLSDVGFTFCRNSRPSRFSGSWAGPVVMQPLAHHAADGCVDLQPHDATMTWRSTWWRQKGAWAQLLRRDNRGVYTAG